MRHRDPDVLRRLYWKDEKSLSEVADELGVSPPTVMRNMKKHDIPRRTAPQDRPPHFVAADNSGHEVVQARVDGDLKAIGVHRLIAVAEYGIDAVAGNDTHHSNGIPWDNRPANIVPKSHGEHSSTTAADRDRNPDGTFG